MSQREGTHIPADESVSETLYLMGIPGLVKGIHEDGSATGEEFVPESDLDT
jgi:hypothetical protein